MSALITPSLVGSVEWNIKCPPSYKEKARQDLVNQLSRIWDDSPKPEIQLGKQFEDAVYAAAQKGKPHDGSKFFNEVVQMCEGAIFQKKTTSYVKIDGIEYCLYGKIDAAFPEFLIDIKTTRNYRGEDHYLSTVQHKMYCYNEQITEFHYVVVEFAKTGNTIVDVHNIPYFVVSRESLKEELITQVKNTIGFISDDEELSRLYKTTFGLY